MQQQPCFPGVQAGQDGLYPGVGEVLADHVPQGGAVLVAVDHPQLGEGFGGGVQPPGENGFGVLLVQAVKVGCGNGALQFESHGAIPPFQGQKSSFFLWLV